MERKLMMVKLTTDSMNNKVVKESWLEPEDAIKELENLIEIFDQDKELAYNTYANILSSVCKQAKEFHKDLL